MKPKVLYVGNFGNGWDGSICDEVHVADALEEFGIEVTRLQRGDLPIPKSKFLFTLISQWDGYGDSYIELLPKPRVYWAFDYQRNGQEWHEKLVAASDVYLSPLLEDKHPNHQWLPQGFAPMFLDKHKAAEQRQEFGEEKSIDVLFTGTYLPEGQFRTDVLRAVDEKYNLHICSLTSGEWISQGFKNVSGPVMDHELPALIATAKINLSVDLFPGNPGCWSDRNAQIMACGGFVLYKYAPLSEEEFGNGVAYFNGIDDCLQKIEHFLNNDTERESIAHYGYIRAHTSLMAVHRVYNLMTILENKFR